MEVLVPSEELFPVFCVALMKTLAPPHPHPYPRPHPSPSRHLYPSSSCERGPNLLNNGSLSFQTSTAAATEEGALRSRTFPDGR